MYNKCSNDPRCIRARQAFNQAFVELLRSKSYQEITIADIARQAGYARHTFYNHYDSKEDLLNNKIDSILGDFFKTIQPGDVSHIQFRRDQEIATRFFLIWRENRELVKVLDTMDMDGLLIGRLIPYYTEIYYTFVKPEIPDLSEVLANYIISQQAYAVIGILRQWFKDEMSIAPEIMGQFVSQFAGIEFTKTMIEKYKDVIR